MNFTPTATFTYSILPYLPPRGASIAITAKLQGENLNTFGNTPLSRFREAAESVEKIRAEFRPQTPPDADGFQVQTPGVCAIQARFY
jgi:hypothetical protein